jgi:hypothetical protein
MDEEVCLYAPTARGSAHGGFSPENITRRLANGSGSTPASGTDTVLHLAQHFLDEGRTNPCSFHSPMYVHVPQINAEASPLVGCGVYPLYQLTYILRNIPLTAICGLLPLGTLMKRL